MPGSRKFVKPGISALGAGKQCHLRWPTGSGFSTLRLLVCGW
jgi:hypothetical protein